MTLIASKLYSAKANKRASIDATNIVLRNAKLPLISTNPAIREQLDSSFRSIPRQSLIKKMYIMCKCVFEQF